MSEATIVDKVVDQVARDIGVIFKKHGITDFEWQPIPMILTQPLAQAIDNSLLGWWSGPQPLLPQAFLFLYASTPSAANMQARLSVTMFQPLDRWTNEAAVIEVIDTLGRQLAEQRSAELAPAVLPSKLILPGR